MAKTKIYSVQPRFTQGALTGGWSYFEQIFGMGVDLPAEGTLARESYLAHAWKNEPMTAGVFNKWVEKIQTVDWKIVGTRNNAKYYAEVFNDAENGRGWTHYCAGSIDFLSTDKGECTELGRQAIDSNAIKVLYEPPPTNQIQIARERAKYDKALEKVTGGRIVDIQHLDSERLVKIGYPGSMWRYYPQNGQPVNMPDLNMFQITPMASARESLYGFGTCALARIIDAKNLMVGYLKFFRQEIGDLPPELAIIINGLPPTAVEDSYNRFRTEAAAQGLDTYKGRWWIGSDDIANPVSLSTHSLLPAQKAFDYNGMVEWWMKTLSLNVGESVGDYWLMQNPGNTNTLMSVQAMKADATGTGRYLQEKERLINYSIMPEGTFFEFDNKDDEQDKRQADILATRITNLKTLAEIGGESPIFDEKKLTELALQWDIIPQEFVSDANVSTVILSTMKDFWREDLWVVDRNHNEYPVNPMLTSDRDKEAAKLVYGMMKEHYAQAI